MNHDTQGTKHNNQPAGIHKFNTTMVAIKGEEICFIAGKYGGKSGWINPEEPADETITPVIVNLGCKGVKSTFVYTSSIRRISLLASPNTYTEAVIQQCPDIDSAMPRYWKNLVTVTRQLAKCDLDRDAKGFQAVINQKLTEARDWQQSKGSKAMYRKIQF